MSWDIYIRRQVREGHNSAHVRARWAGLGYISDVTISGGSRVHFVGAADTRRGMSAFSKPVHGTFRWASGVEHPEVVLEWTDGGEPCQERVLLTLSPHHTPAPDALHETLARSMHWVGDTVRSKVHGR